MIHDSGADWRAAPHKRVMLLGMSGLGKTHLANLLRAAGDWYHYSVDYRIGTRYLDEEITDALKAEAMQRPLLRALLMSDSVRVESNITFSNLAALSAWVGKPGDPAAGGLSFDEYRRRQALHRAAEIAAMEDSARFIQRSGALYGYPHFVSDTSGSICEVMGPDDPLMAAMERLMLPVLIEGARTHTNELIARFDRAPKPMYYRPDFLADAWAEFGREHPGPVDPDAFIRWTYARALAAREPRYSALAARGVVVSAGEVAALRGAEDFVDLIARAIDRKTER